VNNKNTNFDMVKKETIVFERILNVNPCMPFEMGQNHERPCKLVPKPIMNVCMISFGFFIE
jgi:hypothetical protein